MTKIVEVVSDTKAVVKVDNRVKIYLKHDFNASSGSIYFDTDMMLSRRGSDIRFYANVGYVEHTKDTNLLASVVNELFTPRRGVRRVAVNDYQLVIEVTSIASTQEIVTLVLDGARKAGYLVEYRDLDADEKSRRGY